MKNIDLLIVALVLLPFVALGAILYALARGMAYAWNRSRVVVRDLSLRAVESAARQEIREDEAARRELAGSAWSPRVWVDDDGVAHHEAQR